MSYTVLARRYRSRSFDELVGQRAIADTLQRAVEQDRVAHAYLFCGTRGVGKTSLARILACALNVTDELSDPDAVTEAIMRGDDLDVIEIDGASNRGVEQARELIAAAGLSPARSPYRVYIIDEVHMLTSEAFNTLLKTMEEPPSHVKFLLCTTEPHKVPATIRSRCQRFDFRPITRASISDHLAHVLKTEGVEAGPGVLDRVASMGRGSMRDALSVLERLLAAGETSISMEHVEQTLGLPPADLVLSLTDALLDGDASNALTCGETLMQQGLALDQVIESLIDMWRGLMLLRTCGERTDLLDWADATRSELMQRAQLGTPDVFAHGVAVFEALARQASLAASARALFDAALVRLALGMAIEDDEGPSAGAPASGAVKKKLKGASEARSARRSSSVAATEASRQAASKAGGASSSGTKDYDARSKAASEKTLKGARSPGECWGGIVGLLEGSSVQAAAQMLEPVSLESGVLTVRMQGGHSGVVADRIDDMRAAAAKAGVTLQLQEAQDGASPVAQQVHEAGADPLVQMVSDVFDAQVVKVQPPKQQD
ncbi:MAG: DNA polymerase III subunit gamma/tau [Phycisphaerales bacterium]|nr:DNA polymerase III subunit gamma/tau [Phycisphaerales bacterium]